MFSERFRRPRRETAAARLRRRCATRYGLEALEGRQLLAYSPVGSLPDLVVTGQAGPVGAYGAPLAVTLDVRNLGASSVVEPLNLAQGAPSTADAGPSHVGVYLLRGAHDRPGGPGSILVGEVAIPVVPQNSLVRVTGTVTLPARPNRFPASGRTFLGFRADDLRETSDIDRTNNRGNFTSVLISTPLPDLTTIAVDLPPSLQPGDTIAPTIKVANYGTASITSAAPATFLLVASTDTNYGPDDLILGRYVVSNLPGLSQAPSRRTVLGDVNLDNPPNVVNLSTTVDGSQTVTLPAGQSYFIGVAVDPLNEIRELREVAFGPSSALQFVRRVSAIPDLPPAGPVSNAAPATNLFPIPAFAPLGNLQDFLANPTGAAQSATTSVTTTTGTVSTLRSAAVSARGVKIASVLRSSRND